MQYLFELISRCKEPVIKVDCFSVAMQLGLLGVLLLLGQLLERETEGSRLRFSILLFAQGPIF